MKIYLVLLLTFSLHLINMVALSARMVGIRTGKMAASFAVYNILFLSARFAYTLQAPMLAKTVEESILTGNGPDNALFMKVCLVAFAGSLAGAFFIPTVQRLMYKAVEKAYQKNSVVHILWAAFSIKTIRHFKDSLKIPSRSNLLRLSDIKDIPLGIIAINVVVSALLTVSVLSCLYAGYLNPDLRSTSLSLNGFIVGLSTVLFMIVVEPHIGIIADKVIQGEYSDAYFRRYLVFVVIARSLGTALGIFLLVPLAHVVVFLAKSVFI
ncbi:DUF2837 family protein [Emticicia sp. CRIBPO]|uniref:lipid II flippase family protein n=1 Tax=Emticicia sp. CRIBPO TaxID=2683258 RepID=UPI0014123F0E|nr:DUF2837 family protein [Emticicia sp. CRIBPO]NBA85203.1 DUF2837 family protein [Emticicia sp. CRIBPO]